MTLPRFVPPICLLAMCLTGPRLATAEPPGSGAEFASQVTPLLEQYCLDCHAGPSAEAGLELQRFLAPASRLPDREVWEKAARLVAEHEMPPQDYDQPDDDARAKLVAMIDAELARFDCTGKGDPGRVTIRRLNRAEYNNTIRDLIGIDFQPAEDFPSDDVGAGFDNIADVLAMPPILVEKYLEAADEILRRAFADERARQRIYVCDPTAADEEDVEGCYYQIINHFLHRAYRRPVSHDEVQRLLDLGKRAFQQGADPEAALHVSLSAALTSPHFLFRIEHDPEHVRGIRQLNDFELATRLSYFLWSSMPDEELFQLAEAGRLHERAVLGTQVRRMLADDKAEAIVKNFAGQWLQLRDLQLSSPSQELFPDFDDELRAAMRRETELLFAHVMRENRSILELLDADYTFVNGRLAAHYGWDAPTGPEFERVALDGRRRGLLTHASVLLLTSNPTRTSPVKRGKWILENILDDPPRPPAPGVMELEEQPELFGSLRERMLQHRSDPTCAVCHTRMDALGFGLENFDAVGAWRERDGEDQIDASGSLPGQLAFAGPVELIQVLMQHKRDDFARCLVKKLLTYSVGRELKIADRCTIDGIMETLVANEYRFESMVMAIVTSSAFTQRRAEETD